MEITGTNYTNIYAAAYTKSDGKGNEKDTAEDAASDSVKEYTGDGVTLELSGSASMEFKTTGDLMSYLSQKFTTVGKGMVKISSSYLRECLEDEDKLQKLFDMLEDADAMEADAEENVEGYQGMKITIDKDGNMETETYGGSVTFNEAKRARQLAAAKSASNVRVVLSLLNQDLSDCESGVRNGMCDEAEVAKVKAMLQKAMQKMNQVSGDVDGESEEGVDTFSINMLM